jgi:muconate cycloisomerase
MRLASVTLYRVRIPFRSPFVHANATRDSADNVVIRCRTTDGVVGWGEAIAREYVTGETTDSIIDRLISLPSSAWAASLDGVDGIRAMLAQTNLEQSNVASCGVEIALLDALARHESVPIYRLLAASCPQRARVRDESRCRYGGPFGLGSPAATLASAAKLRAFGFRDVKLKLARDLKADTMRLRIARRVLGKGMDLRVDANEAWDLDHAIAMAPLLRRFGVSAVEQPFVKTKNDDIGRFYEVAKLPVIVDESLRSEADARLLAGLPAEVVFAVKLAKVGGFRNALDVVAIAEQKGIGVQIGCQVGESGILSAAGRHLAALCPNLRYLEGSNDRFLLSDNVLEKDITFGWGGVAPVLKGPGLGVDVVASQVERLAVGRWPLFERNGRA